MLKTIFKIESIGLSDIGLVRSNNEDAFALLKEKRAFILADGMGGRQGGEVAAQLAVEVVSKTLPEKIEKQDLKKSFEAANSAIYKKGEEEESLSGMGTTLVLLYLNEEKAFFGHVGDSRVYLWRANNLTQLTRDHTLVNELIDSATITEAEAEIFPYRHILTKALGTNPSVLPSFNSLPLDSGDLFLLCSDGLTNYVPDAEIKKKLSKPLPLEESASLLVNAAKENGGGDNITLILVKVL